MGRRQTCARLCGWRYVVIARGLRPYNVSIQSADLHGVSNRCCASRTARAILMCACAQHSSLCISCERNCRNKVDVRQLRHRARCACSGVSRVTLATKFDACSDHHSQTLSTSIRCTSSSATHDTCACTISWHRRLPKRLWRLCRSIRPWSVALAGCKCVPCGRLIGGRSVGAGGLRVCAAWSAGRWLVGRGRVGGRGTNCKFGTLRRCSIRVPR